MAQTPNLVRKRKSKSFFCPVVRVKFYMYRTLVTVNFNLHPKGGCECGFHCFPMSPLDCPQAHKGIGGLETTDRYRQQPPPWQNRTCSTTVMTTCHKNRSTVCLTCVCRGSHRRHSTPGIAKVALSTCPQPAKSDSAKARTGHRPPPGEGPTARLSQILPNISSSHSTSILRPSPLLPQRV